MKFKLHDLRESKVWKEARAEGKEEGKEEGKRIAKQELIQSFLAEGMTHKRIAELMKMTVDDVRRLGRAHSE